MTRHAPARQHVSRTILIVDDHEIFRQEAREMLETAGYEVIGEAANVADGVAGAQSLEPDIVLLDVQLPDGDGFSAAARIGSQPRPPMIVLVSSREAADYGSLLKNTPAVGFIHKPDLSRRQLEGLIGAAG